MKVQELIKNFDKYVLDLEKNLEVKKYMPVLEKKKFVMDVISTCTDDIDDCITVDRFKMNIYYTMSIIGAYTNLEIASNFDEMIKQYDQLCECNIIYEILELFEQENSIICTMLDDFLEELLVQNSIDIQVVRIANKINGMLDIITDKFNAIDFNKILPEGTDINELVNVLDILK